MDANTFHEKLELVLRRFQGGALKMEEAVSQIRRLAIQPREIPVTQWEQYHPWPSESALRAYIFHADRYDFHDCVVRRKGRVFIKEEAFFSWRERQGFVGNRRC